MITSRTREIANEIGQRERLNARLDTARAIEVARARISLVKFGRGWEVHTWVPKDNATRVSNAAPYAAARAIQRESLIREALLYLEVEDAGAVAHEAAQHEGDWRAMVREALHLIGRTVPR